MERDKAKKKNTYGAIEQTEEEEKTWQTHWDFNGNLTDGVERLYVCVCMRAREVRGVRGVYDIDLSLRGL